MGSLLDKLSSIFNKDSQNTHFSAPCGTLEKAKKEGMSSKAKTIISTALMASSLFVATNTLAAGQLQPSRANDIIIRANDVKGIKVPNIKKTSRPTLPKANNPHKKFCDDLAVPTNNIGPDVKITNSRIIGNENVKIGTIDDGNSR